MEISHSISEYCKIKQGICTTDLFNHFHLIESTRLGEMCAMIALHDLYDKAVDIFTTEMLKQELNIKNLEYYRFKNKRKILNNLDKIESYFSK
jgi:hypothetical protein